MLMPVYGGRIRVEFNDTYQNNEEEETFVSQSRNQ